MISNLIVRCTVTTTELPAPVVGYCRYEGYPFIKFTKNLKDASFFGSGVTIEKADQDNAIHHMRLLPEKDVVKNYFVAWLKEVGLPAMKILYKLELIKTEGPSLEQLTVTVVDTLEGVKEVA